MATVTPLEASAERHELFLVISFLPLVVASLHCASAHPILDKYYVLIRDMTFN